MRLDNTWKERLCKECSKDLGHCPMKFYEGSQEKPNARKRAEICLCHKDYNHCIANNENGLIPEIFPSEDLANINFTKSFVEGKPKIRTTTTTTTQAPEVVQAMGFTVMGDRSSKCETLGPERRDCHKYAGAAKPNVYGRGKEHHRKDQPIPAEGRAHPQVFFQSTRL